MWTHRCLLTLVVTTLGVLSPGLRAQRLATYDPLALPPNRELATQNCPPAPLNGIARQVPHPAAAACPAPCWIGGLAADNLNNNLFYCNGHVAENMQRIPFAGIGGGVAPFQFFTPPGFNQVSGLEVDRTWAPGNQLWVTDGFVLVKYQVPPVPMVFSPILAFFAGPPAVAGNYLTGLANDPNPAAPLLWAVDDQSNLYAFDYNLGFWMIGPVPPPVAVPPLATGLGFCPNGGGAVIVAAISYWTGQVRSWAAGAAIPFPPSPAAGGVRHHRGMAFLGVPAYLGGGGGPVPPVFDIAGVSSIPSPGLTLTVTPAAGGMVLLALDPVAALAGIALGAPGTLWVDPAVSLILGPSPVPITLPLPIPAGIPPGLTFRVQAAEVAAGVVLSDAYQLTTFDL